MQKFTITFLAALFSALCLVGASGQGFTEPDVVFYGEVRKSGGGQTVLLQAGKLEMTFVNQSNPANRVTLTTTLAPTGTGSVKPFSYALKVPLAYLPEAPRMGAFLAVTSLPTSFKIQQITIDGVPATLPDGSKEFYGLSFASRSGEYRLDLLVAGDSNSAANDGIPDWWKQIHGLDTTINVANDDPDGDGWSNLQEFLRGSDPTKSNLVPQLVTSGIRVPESGEAGLFLQFLDSDTPDAGLDITFGDIGGSGFQVLADGSPLAGGAHFKLTDLKAGRLTLKHTDRAVRRVGLPVSWHDGGEVLSGEVLVTVVAPTVEDGSDAALWLNGSDLPVVGTPIATWTDRSGNGRSAMQPLAEYQPLAGAQAADFSGRSSAHLFFQEAALPAGDQTVLASYRTAASSDEAQTLLSTNRGFLQIAATTQAISYPGAPTFQVDNVAVRGYENTAGQTTASIFRRKANLVQNIFGVSYSGENVTADPIDPVLPTLGARRTALPGEGSPVDQSFRGQLQELLVFPQALAEQKLRDVHDYLQSKWGGAVIWNLSTELKPVILTAGPGAQRRIVRGGFGHDQLSGGPGNDILAGGAGDDKLTGGAGSDRFLFGALDTGRKTITDFDQQKDVIDLSALFWGLTGDARQSISVRLDTDYTTPTPTLDSVLVVKLPSGGTQEIVLKGVVLGATQMIQLIVEGRICMGALSIPTTVQIALASGSAPGPIAESLGQSFSVKVTRSGAGVSAALDVPVGFFDSSLNGLYVVDGASSMGGQRAVVNFPRGVTSKTVTVHSVPNLETSGAATLQVAVLPHFEYSIAGTPVQQLTVDNPMVWLEVTQPNAVVTPAQAAKLVLHRDGDLTQNLVVDFQLGGTALNGVHIQPLAGSATILAGQSTREVTVSARAAGLTDGPKVLHFRLASRERYLVGSPLEAVIYVGNTPLEAGSAGFDRWLQASTQGAFTKFDHLLGTAPAKLNDYVVAYGLGLGSVDDLWKNGVVLRIVDGRPELTVPGQLKAADLRWRIQASADMRSWADASSSFVQAPAATGQRFVGPPLDSADRNRFFRVKMDLDPGPSAESGITSLTGANKYGMSGNGNWITEAGTGNLLCAGGNPGETSRIITRVSGPAQLDFQMEINSGGDNDALAFYVDGVRQSVTSGAPLRVQRAWSDAGSHLLMWEFTRGSGQAVIRNLAR